MKKSDAFILPRTGASNCDGRSPLDSACRTCRCRRLERSGRPSRKAPVGQRKSFGVGGLSGANGRGFGCAAVNELRERMIGGAQQRSTTRGGLLRCSGEGSRRGAGVYTEFLTRRLPKFRIFFSLSLHTNRTVLVQPVWWRLRDFASSRGKVPEAWLARSASLREAALAALARVGAVPSVSSVAPCSGTAHLCASSMCTHALPRCEAVRRGLLRGRRSGQERPPTLAAWLSAS